MHRMQYMQYTMQRVQNVQHVQNMQNAKHAKMQNAEMQNVKDAKWNKVGKVDKLFLYPLKGGKCLEQQKCYFGNLGMCSEDGIHDRSFMVVEAERYVKLYVS